jgi:hypothetical protein
MGVAVETRSQYDHWRPSGRRRRFARVATAVVIFGMLVAVGLLAKSRMKAASVAVGCRVSGSAETYALDQDQAANAATITAVAEREGLPAHAVTVALTAALQESNLHNLEYGDRDSLGLFQQRPSQGWGTPTQLMQPTYAARAFYRALQKVPNWESLPITDAAQKVQRSAAPDEYTKWEDTAQDFAAVLTGQVPVGLACHYRPVATDAPPPSYASTLRAEAGVSSSGANLSDQRSWAVAAWLIGHADEYRISSVALRGQKWTAASGKWQPDAKAGADIAVEQQ